MVKLRHVVLVSFLPIFPACGDDSEDGADGDSGGSSTAGSSSSGSAGSSGSSATGGSSGSSAAGSSNGGGSGKSDVGGPCTMDSECPSLSGYSGECFMDWPHGGHCTRSCTFDTDCGEAGHCDEYEGGLKCFVSCANRFDPSAPLPCPDGYACNGESCRPE